MPEAQSVLLCDQVKVLESIHYRDPLDEDYDTFTDSINDIQEDCYSQKPLQYYFNPFFMVHAL